MHRHTSLYLASAVLFALGAPNAMAQPGWVLAYQKINEVQGGFTGPLGIADFFGCSVAALGDLDGDGVSDLAVGAMLDDGPAPTKHANFGAVWVLFMNDDGTVKDHQKISNNEGGLTGELGQSDYFGSSVAALGDLDGDGITDMAVGAYSDSVFGAQAIGAVWVLFLNNDGTVKGHQKINNTEGGFTGGLDSLDFFGYSVAALGDLDGDGITELAVGEVGDDDGRINHGAVWVLFLNSDGTVKSHQKICDTEGGFVGVLDDEDVFGSSVTSLGDLDSDGITDLAVGAVGDDDGGINHGAVWVLFLNSDGTVKSHQKISDTEGGFTGVLVNLDQFGFSVAALGDLDGDGIIDLTVGAVTGDDDVITSAVWTLFLNSDGTVHGHQKISDTEGGLDGVLDNLDGFGYSVAALGDLDGDGINDLAVGALNDDEGGEIVGAVWVLFLDGVPTTPGVPGDLDGSGGVDGADLGLLLLDWGACGRGPACPADLNDDNQTDGADLGILLLNWTS